MIPEAREVRLRPKIRKVLEARCRAPSTPQGDLKRAQIVLLAAEGRSTRSIAKEVGVQPRIVSKWRHRFADHGLAGLNDRPRASKKPIYSQATNRRILALLDKPPPPGYARRTGPLLAMALQDVDVQYVWRFLREHNIDLAARKSWCESNDPEFAAKAADVVGLYIDPPAKAIVLCVDEKPSIQALERAQGYLKLPNGRALTGQSHDYKRHGTTTLFAAIEVASGRIVAEHSKRRRRAPPGSLPAEWSGIAGHAVLTQPSHRASMPDQAHCAPLDRRPTNCQRQAMHRLAAPHLGWGVGRQCRRSLLGCAANRLDMNRWRAIPRLPQAPPRRLLMSRQRCDPNSRDCA